MRELQSLIGLLNLTCSVIVPGRAFLRRLIDLTIGGRRPHHRIRLTKETKHDMEVWLKFLRQFNGRSFPIALSVRIWGSQMANRCIVFVTDNAALVSIINQQKSKHKLVMILIRDLVLTALN